MIERAIIEAADRKKLLLPDETKRKLSSSIATVQDKEIRTKVLKPAECRLVARSQPITADSRIEIMILSIIPDIPWLVS